eukprot:TRINITY_DN6425_c0_g1_i1.p1 TRINITY_DN6425_c0_g1~~TRINITY_DN6425_c0_g1_i1.p1  ORF type:complete len:771 (+),score=146.46 TRINITY_DN6425_c0_g1_i1:137-2449(+)
MEKLRLVLVSEKDDKQGSLFQQYFHSFPNVSVTKNPFEDNESLDCLVVPCPSSFGHCKHHEIAEFYLKLLGDKTKEKIHKHILHQFFGEQNPGTAFITKNYNLKDIKCKYIAWLSLCRHPDHPNIPQDFSYTAMRGLLFELLRFNEQQQGLPQAEDDSNSPIETVLIPSFAFGQWSQTFETKKHVTRLMALAYRNMFYPLRHIPSEEEARILNIQIYERATDSTVERKAKTREMLKSGELEKRGLYYEDELTALVELAGTPNDLQQQAAKALALFLHGTPSEFTLSNETISSAIAQSKECLAYMLDEAEKGNLHIFRTIPTNQIEFGEEIGNGTEATVFQARWNGLDVAVKRFKGVPNSKEFQRELSIMSLMHHPNLLRCYGGFADSHKDVYYLVMDRMDTDLHRALQAHPDDPENNYYRIGFGEALKMALALSRGLEHLHNCGLIHRDLKSVNMLIDRDYNVKLCDFGLSRVVATKKGNNMTGNVGTVSWIAPEVFDNQPYDSKADIYSFGIIMWELYTKQTPFADVNAFEIPRVVTRGDRPPIPKEMPKDYAKLMKQCWHAKPSKRPPAPKIVKELTKMTQIRLFSRSSNSGSSPAPSIGKTSMGGSATNLLQRLAPALTRRTESDRAMSVSSAPSLTGKRSNSTSAGSLAADASSEDSASSVTSPSKEDSSDVDGPQRSESPPPVKKDSPPDSASPSAKRKRSASTAPSVTKPLSSSSEIPAPSAQSPSKATLRAKALLGKAAGDLKSEKKARRLSARPNADTDDDE